MQPVVIREGDDFVEVAAADRMPAGSPGAGDVNLAVAVATGGFAGRGTAWVAAERLAAFLAGLEALETARRGEAVLDGMSPGVLNLRVWAVTGRGHLAVGGRLARDVYAGEAGPHRQAVEFGFEFDPTQLPAVLAGFRAIARNASGAVRDRDRDPP